MQVSNAWHDDVIKWKHLPRYWPFVRGIHRSPVNSPHKGQWHRALMFSLICAWINGWVNNRGGGNLRRHRAQSDVIVMRYVQVQVLRYVFRVIRVLWALADISVALLASVKCESDSIILTHIQYWLIPIYWSTLVENATIHFILPEINSARQELMKRWAKIL